MPSIEILVSADVTFTSGKFASRDDIVDALKDEINDPGSLTVNEGEYEVSSWSVDEHVRPSAVEVRAEQKKAKRQRALLVVAVEALDGLKPGEGRSESIRQLVKDLRAAFSLPEPGKPDGEE